MSHASQTPALTSIQYEFEIHMEAPKEKVWRALTEDIDTWWLPDFHMVGTDSKIQLDAIAGGHLVESKADGSSLLWYTVQMCDTGHSLHLAGFIFPQWGGPGTTLLHLSLESVDDGTKFKVQDSQFGAIQASAAKSMEDGWIWLFTDGLKKHAEA